MPIVVARDCEVAREQTVERKKERNGQRRARSRKRDGFKGARVVQFS